MYSFTYSLDDTDYWEFSKFLLTHSKVFKRWLLAVRASVPFITLILFFTPLITPEGRADVLIYFTVSIAASIMWFFLAKPLYFRDIEARIARHKKKHGALPYGKNVQIQFGEEDIFEVTEKAKMKIKYSNIERIEKGSHGVYIIYNHAMNAFIIPFSVFENEEQKNGFLVFICKKKSDSAY